MKNAKVRITETTAHRLQEILFSRYPDQEAATFLQCSWAEGVDSLVVTVNELFAPKPGDVDPDVGNVGLLEPYTLRRALHAAKNKDAIGLIHSHPEDCGTWPSTIDDDMDSYYSNYFLSFTKAPYISLILSKTESGALRFSGRVFYKGKWIQCLSLQIVGKKNQMVYSDVVKAKILPEEISGRLERMTGVLGKKTAEVLWRSQAVIIGGGGTGSALFHSLVRSCVGRIIVLDPDLGVVSNTERVHGFYSSDLLGDPIHKVTMLQRLAKNINPLVEVVALPIDARSELGQKYIIESDIVFGCTDTQTGRIIVSDASTRFLLPAFHVNVAMEAENNKLTGEIIHITKYSPELPCAYCRDQIHAQRLSQELMSSEERDQRKKDQIESGAKTGTYWLDEPVIHTVGSLTTVAAELVANYGVGLLTGLYDAPADFMEVDVLRLNQGAIVVPMKKREGCTCNARIGVAGLADGWIGAL
ncbi:MAG: ThiF family adenylyltransferase [Pseudobdellovibrio sp.]